MSRTRQVLARIGAAAAAFALACFGPEQPAAVTVTPDTVTLDAIGQKQQFTATVTDKDGKTLTDAVVVWTSSDVKVTTIDSTGRATAVGSGTSDVTATAGTVAGTAQVTVDPSNNVAKVAGDNQYGYQGTRLPQFIQVRVRDRSGNGVVSHPVQFTTALGNGTADSSVAFTDPSGVARTGWVMPNAVDTVTLEAKVLSLSGTPLLGSPVTFTAISHNVRVTGVSPATLTEGETATITGSGFDPGNTQNAITMDGVSVTITAASATQLTVTVPRFDCRPPGNVTVQVTVAGIPAGPLSAPLNASISPLNVQVGQQTIVTDPAQFCFQFSATSAGEAYLIGVQSNSEVVSTLTPISLVGTIAGGVSAAPTLASQPAPAPQAPAIAPQTASRLKHWLRYWAAEAKQRAFDAQVFRQLAGTFRAPREARTPAVVGPDVAVGDAVQVRVTSGASCTNYAEITTVVRAKGTTGILLEDVGNPAGGLTASHFNTFSQQYDDKTYPTDAAEFGAPTDRDGNGRIVIVVTKEVNKRGSLGFTTSCDLGARATYPASNEGEFFYVLAPDPTGTVGDTFDLQSATLSFPDIIAHESVHVIQFGRRQAAGAAQFLDLWVAEGQAVIGEEVVGHAVEGRQTGQNYGLGIAINLDDTTSTDWYSTGFVGLGLYFGWDPITNPSNNRGRAANAPWECTWLDTDYGGPCVGDLDPYGPPWSLLRYLNDRFGPTYAGGEAGIQKAIIEHPQAGFTMLQSVIGVRIDTLLAQWAAMLFADDSVPNAAPNLLAMPSWNLRDIFYGSFAGLRLIPELRLAPVSLTFSAFTRSANVRAASTYYAVISGSNRPAAAIKARDASGTGILPSTMRYWIVRIQ